MGATREEREVDALLKKFSRSARFTRHGRLHVFGPGVTVLINRHEGARGADQRLWKNVLRDVRSAVRSVHGDGVLQKDDDEEVEVAAPEVRPTQVTAVRGSIPHSSLSAALPGLVPKVKESRIVMVEKTTTLELAPHHVHELLRRVGHDVPDDAKVSFTNEGYVRVAWTKASETTEG